MMLRILAALVLLVFAAGFVVEACGPAASTSSPGATPATTIPVPSSKPRTPSATIEVPPPIN